MAHLLTRRLRVTLGLLVVATLIAPAAPVASPASPAVPVAAVPASAPDAGPDTGPSDPPSAQATTPQAAPVDDVPSAEYLDAMAHADDKLDFVPGGPATVALPPDVADPAPDPAVAPFTEASTATANRPLASTAAATPRLRREVLGFLPYWTLGSRDLRLDYASLSTIAYFAVGAGPDGHLQTRDPDGTSSVGWAGWSSRAMTNVINAAHAHGVRVVLTVERFAWTRGQAADTVTLLSSSMLRARLAAEVAKAVHDRGADGVNLDFEPIPDGQAADYVAFVRQLRADLDARRAGYELTFDATGSIGNYDIGRLTAPGAADAVMIMGYDYRGAGSSVAGSIDPLAGPMYDLTDTVDAYLSQTAPGKIILGVPYYGRAWSTSGSGLHASTLAPSSHDGYSATATYAQAVALAAAHGRHYDGLEQAPWTTYSLSPCSGCPKVTRELYYDDAASLGLRYDLVNRKGLRGAGIWALGYDGTRPELAAELRAKFISDTTAPVAGLLPLPPVTGDAGFTVAWRATDDRSGIAWYDVQVSVDGGAWRPWLTHVTTTSATYLGAQGHGYAFRVRAADGRGNVSPFNVGSTYSATPALRAGGFAQVQADGVNVRAAPDTSAAVVLQATAGTDVALMAGPVSADGLQWFEVALPVTTWGPTADQQLGVWMAAAVGSTTYLAPIQAPNATLVSAAITGFSFDGAGAASLGAAGAAHRSFSPNGDGHGDTLRLDWTDATALTGLTLNVFRSDGSLAGTVAVGARGAGPQSYLWDGAVGSTILPSGTYILQLVGRDGSGLHHAPTTTAVGTLQLQLYGVALHRVGVERLAGADRYATAAAISRVAAQPGVATVVIASGAGFADGLGASTAAAALHGPLLLVQPQAIPAATAAELTRLHPGRIIVVGGPGSVAPSVVQGLAHFTTGGVTRLSGVDRYATAAAVSAAVFRPGVPVAYLVDGQAFPDGVAAAAAAAHGGGPLLLSRPDALAPATMAELQR
ncbi:MAG TPA: glycosyl hydrolase family 18 protein, partial [Candidatus Sulfotelmatobacter sp.]|nr:glycosyl hydrolase family 18 protein [Candidatus Sulfotelmatobacter sp.]